MKRLSCADRCRQVRVKAAARREKTNADTESSANCNNTKTEASRPTPTMFVCVCVCFQGEQVTQYKSLTLCFSFFSLEPGLILGSKCSNRTFKRSLSGPASKTSADANQDRPENFTSSSVSCAVTWVEKRLIYTPDSPDRSDRFLGEKRACLFDSAESRGRFSVA